MGRGQFKTIKLCRAGTGRSKPIQITSQSAIAGAPQPIGFYVITPSMQNKMLCIRNVFPLQKTPQMMWLHVGSLLRDVECGKFNVYYHQSRLVLQFP